MGTGTADEKVHELMKQYKRWTKGKLLERLRVLEKQRVSDEMSSKEKAEARQKECARLFYLRKRIREGSFTLFLKEQWLETREANPRLWARLTEEEQALVVESEFTDLSAYHQRRLEKKEKKAKKEWKGENPSNEPSKFVLSTEWADGMDVSCGSEGSARSLSSTHSQTPPTTP